MTIERSAGLPIMAGGMPTGYVAGGGYRGLTDELDSIVEAAARWLEAWSGMDVTIRFNSDRESGSAWLLTDPDDGIWKNAELGIGAAICDHEWDDDVDDLRPIPRALHVHAGIKPVCLIDPASYDPEHGLWQLFDTLDEAFVFVESNATTERLR